MKLANTSKGFTLIEVMIVSAMVSVFLVGLPTTTAQFFSQKHYMLQKYRSSAIAWNTSMKLFMVGKQLRPRSSVKKADKVIQWEQNWRWQRVSQKTISGNILRHQVNVYEEGRQNPISTLVIFTKKF